MYWDLASAVRRHTKFGHIGRYATGFLPVDAWTLKANRELVLALQAAQPDVFIVSGNMPVRAGALAQIRVQLPRLRIVLLWPDSLLNLSRHVIEALPVYDLIASYSKASMGELLRLGARRVEWFPFAADPILFPQDLSLTSDERAQLSSDVCFIGNHRPEREEAVLALLAAGLKVRVWGDSQSWGRHAQDKRALRAYFQGRPLFGIDFARAVMASRISLNPIDPTNYPSANMRFFESPACGGATLNSACPEMEPVFPDGKAAFYYDSVSTLAATARKLMEVPRRLDEVAKRGRELVLSEHSYESRASHLLSVLAV
jgi:spore maturation protein CgeB